MWWNLNKFFEKNKGLKYIKQVKTEECKSEKNVMEYLDKYVEVGLIDRLTKVLTCEFKRVSYKECIEILFIYKNNFKNSFIKDKGFEIVILSIFDKKIFGKKLHFQKIRFRLQWN